MKKNKIKELQLEILKRYYRIEEDEVYIDLYYETFSELIDNNLGGEKVEMGNEIIFDELEKAFSLIPKYFNIHLIVHIKDFGNYHQEEAKTIIMDNIYLKIYSLMLANARKKRLSYTLLVSGALILILSYFLAKTSIPTIITDIINISGTLLIWESASQFLIERSSNLKHATRYINKIKEIEVM